MCRVTLSPCTRMPPNMLRLYSLWICTACCTFPHYSSRALSPTLCASASICGGSSQLRAAILGGSARRGRGFRSSWQTILVLSPVPHHLRRMVTDGSDRSAWLYARSRGITATDVAKLSSPRSIEAAAHMKLHGSRFSGNAYTDHGKAREPVIAAWVLQEYGIAPSQALFHAELDRRHLATPDGLALRESGHIELSEIKTTNKEWRTIPRHYLRQVWWQQYVLGAERTLMVWERHENFVPVGDPECRWIDRDENEIAQLVHMAGQLIDVLIQRTT